PLAMRKLVFDHHRRLSLRVTITRSCLGVVCPLPDGDPSLTACLGGTCVSPRCLDGTEPECAARAGACTSPDECAIGSPCATPVCEDSICLAVSDEGACPPGQY